MSEGENGWKSNNNNNNNEDGLTQVETCDVTFVDDEALFLERKSPDRLVEDTEKVALEHAVYLAPNAWPLVRHA